MKAFQRNTKPSLATHVDRSNWKIVMIPGHYPIFIRAKYQLYCIIYVIS
jgi:hypothetical protein